MTQFDGPNRRITLDEPTGGVLNVLVQRDLYSESKVWLTGNVEFDTEDDVNGTTERITIDDHSTYTGQRSVYSPDGGSEAIGLTDGTEYFIRRVDRDTIELYDTKVNAEAGPSTTGRIDLTASGVGNGETHKLVVDNSKFPPPFRTVGGDDLTPGVQAGAYFFLQNQVDSDWRIISSDEDQTDNYNGNLVAEDSSLPLIVATPGRTVLHLGLQPVTQRVDEILTQTQVAAYNGVVAIDVLSTNTGTEFPVGTLSTPVNNIADAQSIADDLGIKSFVFRGDLTLDRNLTQWSFRGVSSEKSDSLDLAGFDVDGSIFYGCGLSGSYTGLVEAVECDLNVLTGLRGVFRRCGLTGSMITLSADAEVVLANCFSEVPGNGTPVISCNGANSLNLRNYSGGIELRDIDDPGFTASVDLDPGTIKILDGQNNSEGYVLMRGLGTKEIGPIIEAQGAGTPTIDDRLFDVKEAQIAMASLVGDAIVSADDLTVQILDKNLNVLRELSVSADGRTRNIN